MEGRWRQDHDGARVPQPLWRRRGTVQRGGLSRQQQLETSHFVPVATMDDATPSAYLISVEMDGNGHVLHLNLWMDFSLCKNIPNIRLIFLTASTLCSRVHLHTREHRCSASAFETGSSRTIPLSVPSFECASSTTRTSSLFSCSSTSQSCIYFIVFVW